MFYGQVVSQAVTSMAGSLRENQEIRFSKAVVLVFTEVQMVIQSTNSFLADFCGKQAGQDCWQTICRNFNFGDISFVQIQYVYGQFFELSCKLIVISIAGSLRENQEIKFNEVVVIEVNKVQMGIQSKNLFALQF
eukprot:TRINITY_DN11015_c0_g1_i1.p2 TRINITY_DN11015_c0_g1~~TRINITY_DN11015_c0_g1_i1.p2  ORF type:complete len:135 (-),score=4.95 TRINITY_DN11015_c0_g1_i1:194-598(-)